MSLGLLSSWLSIFTARRHSAVLAIVNPSFRPSVRPSVRLSVSVRHTLALCQTTQATIMESSLKDSRMTLVSSGLTSPQNSKGSMGSEGAK